MRNTLYDIFHSTCFLDHRWPVLTRCSETQGEKAYKAGDPRSRASSSASESRTPSSMKVEPPFLGPSGSGTQGSSMDSITPRTSGNDGGSLQASNYTTMQEGTFQPVNYPGSSTGSKRTAGEAQLTDNNIYPVSSSTGGPSRSFGNQMDSQDTFASGQSGLDDSFMETRDVNYTTALPQLPMLSIPDGNWYPELSYSNSPWNCSSASSSTYSTSDGSKNAPQFPYTTRGRSLSVATQPDWTTATTAPYWTPGMHNTSQDMRSPGGFDNMLDAYETPFSSPRISTPVSARTQLLNIPTSMEGFYTDLSVGTPTLPTYSKPVAQVISASTPRYTSNSGLELLRGQKELVEPPQLTSTFSLITPTFQPQASLNPYLSSYWQYFHQSFPIIHEATFDPSQYELLTSAVAAIGTQYHDSSEARTKGAELNDYCRKGIELVSQFSSNQFLPEKHSPM